MSGSYLRHSDPPEPKHACILPHENQIEGASPEERDVWRCAVCERVYIYTDHGYGFGWHRVRWRKWWYEFRYGWRQGRGR